MPEAWTGRLVGKMHNKEISCHELAGELGCSKAYVSMILNGRRNPHGARAKFEAAVDHIILRRKDGNQQ